MSKIKVAYNGCYGGFGLSKKAEKKLWKKFKVYYHDLERHDPRLIWVIEKLGKKANGGGSDLDIWEIEGNQYNILEYDGSETVQTPKNIWWTTVDVTVDYIYQTTLKKEKNDGRN